jgi:hypothetical protein
MNNSGLEKNGLLHPFGISNEAAEIKEKVSFNWQDSSSVQRLLDVITSIIAEEYITVAKQNPTVFSEIASPPSGIRNDKL